MTDTPDMTTSSTPTTSGTTDPILKLILANVDDFTHVLNVTACAYEIKRRQRASVPFLDGMSNAIYTMIGTHYDLSQDPRRALKITLDLLMHWIEVADQE